MRRDISSALLDLLQRRRGIDPQTDPAQARAGPRLVDDRPDADRLVDARAKRLQRLLDAPVVGRRLGVGDVELDRPSPACRAAWPARRRRGTRRALPARRPRRDGPGRARAAASPPPATARRARTTSTRRGRWRGPAHPTRTRRSPAWPRPRRRGCCRRTASVRSSGARRSPRRRRGPGARPPTCDAHSRQARCGSASWRLHQRSASARSS